MMKRKNKKNRRNSIRVMAAAMAVIITAGFAGTCGYQRSQITAKAADISTEELETVAEQTVGITEDNSDEAKKEESVYVKADASGKATQTTVTEWLKNTGEGSLADTTELQDIRNVKGEETYSESEDGILWDSNGEDIYYQGTTEKELPVGVEITYKLDGKEISAEDLAGKSGKLEMKIKYTNNSKETVNVSGREEEMYVPFTMVTALMFPADEYQNVEIDHGKVISDAEREIVVGMGFPGLNENLKLNEIDGMDLELPDEVTITADVENASVGETITVATTEFLNEMNLDEIDSFDDLEQSIISLKDATNQLVEGSKEAASGARELANGASELSDGTGELAEGTNRLKNGVDTLNDKSGSMISGVQELSGGIISYTQGVDQLASGISGDGTAENPGLVSGTASLTQGANAVASGVRNVSDTLGTLQNYAQMAEKGTESVSAALGTGTSEQPGLQTAIGAIQATATVNAGAGSVSVDESALREALVSAGIDADKASVVAQQVASNPSSYCASSFSSNDVTVTITGKETALGMTQKIKAQIDDPTKGLAAATAGVSGGIGSLKAGIDSTDASNPGLVVGADNVAAGAAALQSGTEQVKAGVESLQSYNGLLTGGASSLLSGGQMLTEGIGQLSAGTDTLNAGAEALDTGAGTLTDGALALAEGNEALAEGMAEYKEEAIDKLTDLFEGDISNLTDRMEAMIHLGNCYQSFAGIRPEMSGSTKFIIETAGAEK